MKELIDFDTDKKFKKSILDLGCGLGHFYQYLITNHIDIEYTGLDISHMFVEKCKEKYPGIPFIYSDILKGEIYGNYSYIVMNGLFTEKRELAYSDMKTYFEMMIEKAFYLCNRGLAFNVMSKDVDWERDDLFHLPLSELSRFLCEKISRNFIIRNDYGLYEYTTYVYK